MRLGTKQELFMRLLPRLIDHVHSLGYEIRGGDLFRDPRMHGPAGEHNVVTRVLLSASKTIADMIRWAGFKGYGHKLSGHKLKLAIDLNITEDGVYLRGDAAKEAHSAIHDFWDALGGAERIPHDLNHYSLEHQGMR